MPKSNTTLNDEYVEAFPSKTEEARIPPYLTSFPKLTTNRSSLLKEIGDINIREAKASLLANDVISCLEYPR